MSADGFVDAFNACESPKQCLALVDLHGLSCDAFCQRMHAARPDAVRLGECLGHHHQFWQACALRFAMAFTELRGLDIVAALRLYLFHFRLPGESGPIGRILEGFARGFVHYNPPFSAVHVHGSSDAADERLGDAGLRQVDATSVGWFVRQPMVLVGRVEKPCCVACGAVANDEISLRLCSGCGVVHFCRRCARLSSRHGHSVCCSVGYGRACVAATAAAGTLWLHDGESESALITYRDARGQSMREPVRSSMHEWPVHSPVKDEDAALVLSYAIVMLSTNQHNKAVRQADKMGFGAFAKQVQGVNGGSNFPADFLHGIYEAVSEEELKVRR